MRGLNSDCIDLIYLDPPFNSNRNYEAPVGSKAAGAAFKDMWELSSVDVCEHGELAERSPAAYSVIEAARATHGKGMMSYLIFMAVRLIETKRILKETGSIYLHCDDTAGHYLKLLMDAIFGANNGPGADGKGGEITWKRTFQNGASAGYGRISDTILFYKMSSESLFNTFYSEHSDDYIRKNYRHKDKRGVYRTVVLTAPGNSNLIIWRGYSPTQSGRSWAVPSQTAMPDDVKLPANWQELSTTEKLEFLYKNDLIIFSRNGVPSFKRYLSTTKGVKLQNIWTDINPISSRSKERSGYPTQKPLALLERIISASSAEEDVVFDPFCGCATTLVAAHNLGRKWGGCDLSPLTVKLVNNRILEFDPLFGRAINPDHPPIRTDTGEVKNYRTHKHELYGKQEGICNGCDTHFPFKIMEVDHILPRSRGGTNAKENLQILCSHCNRSKGDKTMSEWKAGAFI